MSWIETNFYLPKACDTVLICTNQGNVCSGYLHKRCKNLWTLHNREISSEIVIAWQPLPEPLKYTKALGEDHGADLKDFNEDDLRLGGAAFAECQNHIKQVVSEYFIRDEIKDTIHDAIIHGMKQAFEEGTLDNCFEKGFEDGFRDLEIEFKMANRWKKIEGRK